MRPLLYITVLLSLLLSLCSINGFAAAAGQSCGFDAVKNMRERPSVAVVREVPAKGQGAWQAYTASTSETWAPIRILVSTIDLNDTNRYCTKAGELRPNYIRNNETVCHCSDILSDEKKNTLINLIIPEAVKLHQERLLVKPFEGTLKMPSIVEKTACDRFSIPPEHRDPGFSGYDTVMYAAAGPKVVGYAAAWAVMCATLPDGRPVAGAISFTPEHITYSSEMVRIVAHEMAHILGFDNDVFFANQMITTVKNIRGKTNTYMLTSEKLIERAREHYNCSTIMGVELENEGGRGTWLSHWDAHNAKDELMSATGGIGYYTALTMAAFEGTKYYKANWGMEETMSWGKDAGCRLHTEKCITNNINNFPDLFCNETTPTPVCTSDRRSLGTCALVHYADKLPVAYRYFRNPTVGGRYWDMTDMCPIISPIVNGECTNRANDQIGSRVGPSSWCMKGKSLELRGFPLGDVCAEVKCGNESFQVRYYGDENWYPCPEGTELQLKSFTKGSIVCPKYREVCTIAPNGSSRIGKNISLEVSQFIDAGYNIKARPNLVSGESEGDGHMTTEEVERGMADGFIAAVKAPFEFLVSVFSKISIFGKH